MTSSEAELARRISAWTPLEEERAEHRSRVLDSASFRRVVGCLRKKELALRPAGSCQRGGRTRRARTAAGVLPLGHSLTPSARGLEPAQPAYAIEGRPQGWIVKKTGSLPNMPRLRGRESETFGGQRGQLALEFETISQKVRQPRFRARQSASGGSKASAPRDRNQAAPAIRVRSEYATALGKKGFARSVSSPSTVIRRNPFGACFNRAPWQGGHAPRRGARRFSRSRAALRSVSSRISCAMS